MAKKEMVVGRLRRAIVTICCDVSEKGNLHVCYLTFPTDNENAHVCGVCTKVAISNAGWFCGSGSESLVFDNWHGSTSIVGTQGARER
jgi:hypothetical protein